MADLMVMGLRKSAAEAYGKSGVSKKSKEAIEELTGVLRGDLRLFESIDEFKAAIARGENVFDVGKHSDITPRPTGINGIAESHHGVNSVWMKAKYSDYNLHKAPSVYMLKNTNHNATRSIFPKWRAEIRGKQGGTKVDYSKVTESEILDLAKRQFDAADVPQSIRNEYYKLWREHIKTLTPF